MGPLRLSSPLALQHHPARPNITPLLFGCAIFSPTPWARPSSQTTTVAPLSRSFSTSHACCRHASVGPRHNKLVPATTPFVPDVQTFLRLIGRNLKRYADKFPTWAAMFELTSRQLRELGVEPARDRRYLLRWLEKFRNGQHGPGGDFRFVKEGLATLRVGHDELTDRHWVSNVPALISSPAEIPLTRQVLPRCYHVKGANRIVGPYAIPNPKEVGGATVKLMEGMWEERRGQKLDGGERRRAEVRFKKKLAERRAAREEAARRGLI